MAVKNGLPDFKESFYGYFYGTFMSWFLFTVFQPELSPLQAVVSRLGWLVAGGLGSVTLGLYHLLEQELPLFVGKAFQAFLFFVLFAVGVVSLPQSQLIPYGVALFVCPVVISLGSTLVILLKVRRTRQTS